MGVAMLVGVVVALAAPAAAKGVASLTVTGPGIPIDAPIEVSGRTHPAELEDIFASSGVPEALPDLGSSALATRAGTVDLGPRHALTWHVMTGPGEMTPLRQDLYLQADGGPLTYTEPGQPIWGGVTRGGWYRAPERLRQALADACVPIIGDFEASAACSERRMAAKAASASVGTANPREREQRSGSSSWPEAIAGITAATALIVTGGMVAHKRTRRRRMAPISL